MATIEIRDLHLSFAGRPVLRGVDLAFAAGERLALIGPSGGGKSVLAKCILGILRPDRGAIAVDGRDVRTLTGHEREALMRRCGVLFQAGALFDSLPIWENVAFGLVEGRGMARDAARRIALDKLAAVGLDADVADLLPDALSGGMRRRVALARAIAADAELLFLDDPTAGLDPITTAAIDGLIEDQTRALRATTLVITQDMASVRRLADQVAMLYQGRIIWTGTAASLDRPGNAYVEQFVEGRAEGPIPVDGAAAAA